MLNQSNDFDFWKYKVDMLVEGRKFCCELHRTQYVMYVMLTGEFDCN